MLKKTFFKYTLIGLAVFFLLLIFVPNYFVANFLENKVNHANLGQLHLRVADIETSVINRAIYFNQVNVEDSAQNFSLNIDQVEVHGFHVLSLFFHKDLLINKLTFQKPVFRFKQNFRLNTQAVAQKGKASIKYFKLKELTMLDGTICIVDSMNTRDSILNTTLSFTMTDLQNRNIEQNLNHWNYSCKSLDFDLKNFSFLLPSKEYQLKVSGFSFRTEAEQCVLDSFKLIPLYNKYALGRKEGVETNWYKLDCNRLVLEKLNFHRLMNDKMIRMRKLYADSLRFETFKDKRLADRVQPDKKIPRDILESIPWKYNCDSLVVHHADIHYALRAENSVRGGYLDFENTKIQVARLSNLDEDINSPITAHGESLLCGQGRLHADFKFEKNASGRDSWIKGYLEPVYFSAFNSITEPNLGLKTIEGRVDLLQFEFQYNNSSSAGHLLMDYHNLKVQLSKKNHNGTNKLTSTIVNTFILKSNNIPGEKDYKTGTIQFERDKKRSFLSYWWKSIYSGIKDIVI
jgi:hypothetical protein